MPQPAEPSPLDRDQSDPLLLFAEEPAAPKPPAETPPKTSPEIERPLTSPEFEAMRTRAEAAEKSLREARRTVAALKREMATLVTAATNKPANRPGWPTAAAAALILLVSAAAIAWRFLPISEPPVVTAAAPSSPVAAVEPAPASSEPTLPVPAVAPVVAKAIPVSAPLPARAAPVRPANGPAPAREYVGTLSVDAVPAGGEVFINRKSVGKTPARITGLRAGSHLVWIQRPGYRLWTRVVLVPADKISRVSVALEPDNAVAMRP